MIHYICTGICGGMSSVPGTCQAEECERHGKPLLACECTDGTHHGAGENSHKEGGNE